MIRPEVRELIQLGAFAASKDVNPSVIKRQQQLLQSIMSPVSDAEARELIKLFGPDDYYGLAWTILHLVEGAPDWPLMECLSDNSNEWIDRLKERVTRKRFQTSDEQ